MQSHKLSGIIRGGLDYVQHRLKMSGREDMLFTDGALMLLYKLSGGVPRVIYSIATSALLDGFSQEAPIIDNELIEAAAQELTLHGYSEN